MTGFGHAQVSSRNYKVTVELKSLNSKFLEISVKLPPSGGEQEIHLRSHMGQLLKRGKILGSIHAEVLNPELAKLKINEGIVEGYAKTLKAFSEKIGLNSELRLDYLLSLPHAFSEDDAEDDPEEWQLIEKAVKEALTGLVESRSREGVALEDDLRTRCKFIVQYLGEVQEMVGPRIDYIKNRLSISIAELRDRISVDENRFEQEILFYLEKLDINEEIVRLRKHLDYFDATLREQESNGRRLNFISQEMGREINTIGSKANDASMQVCVVKMKEELEKIKEQLNNVL